MADPKTEQEPSIEEILESIRQIISEDGEPAAPASTLGAQAPVSEEPRTLATPPAAPEIQMAPAAPAPAASDDDDDDILDLTEKAVPAQQPVIEMNDLPEEKPAPAYTHQQPAAPAPGPGGALSGEALVSDMTADISANAMARLLAGNVAVERDVPGRVGNVTLEDMARELLRPLLKTWLDQNLPPLIERMVAKEIEKISRLAMKQ
jgi:cell pole-organizing protein PopZ